jgi:hypothetical protein
MPSFCEVARLDMPTHARVSDAVIFHHFVKACPVTFLSFRNQKIPHRFLLRFLPELKFFVQKFHPAALLMWRSEMECHNQEFKRGIRMGLCPEMRSNSLTFSTLDGFMCRLHNADLAAALNALCQFGKRILSRIERKPTAQIWSVSGAMMITKQSWQEFRDQVDTLVSLLGIDSVSQTAPSTPWQDKTYSQDQRPEFYLLQAAATRWMILSRKAANSY